MKKLFTYSLRLCILFIFCSCQKENTVKEDLIDNVLVEKFFKLSSITNDNVKEFALEIKKQNEQNNFLIIL